MLADGDRESVDAGITDSGSKKAGLQSSDHTYHSLSL